MIEVAIVNSKAACEFRRSIIYLRGSPELYDNKHVLGWASAECGSTIKEGSAARGMCPYPASLSHSQGLVARAASS